MTFSLPGVNIWIALAAEGHVHHCAGTRVVRRTSGRFRCLLPGNPNGPASSVDEFPCHGGAPRTIVQAWETFEKLSADQRLVFATEPAGVESAWRELMTQPGVGPSSWTDAYLAAFAEAHSYSLVTFDTWSAASDATGKPARDGQAKLPHPESYRL